MSHGFKQLRSMTPRLRTELGRVSTVPITDILFETQPHLRSRSGSSITFGLLRSVRTLVPAR